MLTKQFFSCPEFFFLPIVCQRKNVCGKKKDISSIGLYQEIFLLCIGKHLCECMPRCPVVSNLSGNADVNVLTSVNCGKMEFSGATNRILSHPNRWFMRQRRSGRSAGRAGCLRWVQAGAAAGRSPAGDDRDVRGLFPCTGLRPTGPHSHSLHSPGSS